MRASLFSSFSEDVVPRVSIAPAGIVATSSKPPAADTVEKAQQLVSNYVTEQLERTGQDGQFKRHKPEPAQDDREKPPLPAFLTESQGLPETIVNIVGRNPDVQSISDTGSRGNVEQLFANRLKTNGRPIDELVATIPSPQECAVVINRIEKPSPEAGWNKTYVGIAIERGLEIPFFESLVVTDVSDFLRPADPSVSFERPCKPLIDAKTNMPGECESVLMGRSILREFLLPSMVHSKQLPKFQRCCFLCMQRFVTIESGKKRAKQKHDDDDEWRVILHDYEMVCNRPGGFNGKLQIPRNGKPCGVAGSVLIHDRNLYVPKTFQDSQGRPMKGWQMSDEMLFRPGATNAL